LVRQLSLDFFITTRFLHRYYLLDLKVAVFFCLAFPDFLGISPIGFDTVVGFPLTTLANTFVFHIIIGVSM
jgi:hypothetical protein